MIFLGCLRPDVDRIDMPHFGFYEVSENIGNTGLNVYNAGLCEKLRSINH